MKTETCELYSRDFWIFLPNIIKIDQYNFELYSFKVGPFFRHSVDSASVGIHVGCSGEKYDVWTANENYILTSNPQQRTYIRSQKSRFSTNWSYLTPRRARKRCNIINHCCHMATTVLDRVYCIMAIGKLLDGEYLDYFTTILSHTIS